ncbi:hypothetical protein [Desulforhopalus singaporensis]
MNASFWRDIKSTPQQGRPVILRILCRKYHCRQCGRYFQHQDEWNQKMEPFYGAPEKQCVLYMQQRVFKR